MGVNENGNLRPDGFSISLGPVGGTYFWNPGSPTAPSVTLTGTRGLGGGGLQGVFLRPGKTSLDTLGYGATGTASTIFPSATVNASIPDSHGIPQPLNAQVTSVESGIALPGFGTTYTATPQQVAARIADMVHLITPAMGPDDELPPFFRMLRTGHATVGPPVSPPVSFLSPSQQNPLGNGMGDWKSSTEAPIPGTSRVMLPPSNRPGGLPGLMTDAGLIDPSNPDQPPPGGPARSHSGILAQ
jgi:hypothetical protein